MHAVHHPIIGPEDDRVRHVDILDQSDVLDDLADRRLLAAIEPVDGVEFPNRRQREVLDAERGAQRDQPINIPGIEPLFTRPEVVLLPHATSVAASIGNESTHRHIATFGVDPARRAYSPFTYSPALLPPC